MAPSVELVRDGQLPTVGVRACRRGLHQDCLFAGAGKSREKIGETLGIGEGTVRRAAQQSAKNLSANSSASLCLA